MVVDADDVTGVGLIDVASLLGHEDGGVGEDHLFINPMVAYLHAPFEFAGADSKKKRCDPGGQDPCWPGF